MNTSRLSATVPSTLVRSSHGSSWFLAMTTLDVEVIEVFPSASSIPPDYATSSCCRVGIWTKRGG